MRFIPFSLIALSLVLVGCQVRPSSSENPASSAQPSPATTRAENALKIMPLGDSITAGHDVPGGYRTVLWQKLSDRGNTIDFVGSARGGPRDLPDKDHEGHSGWRIDDLRGQIEPWLAQNRPDMVLLTIGSNDILHDDAVETAPDRVRALLGDIFARVPDATILVASIPPMADAARDRQVREYNTELENLVEEEKAAGKPVFFVDIYSVVGLNDLPDGLHPNAEGHRKMAGAWDEAIAEVLNVRN
ncbi:MAG: SGNH/GDSL hydrolase family protein [Cyanobacteriota bacterium]|nr:SGNH/GDSL hydrolase family protein [Cyanobacteriota bacterium]